jgi:hypothetical protein
MRNDIKIPEATKAKMRMPKPALKPEARQGPFEPSPLAPLNVRCIDPESMNVRAGR